ncbi:unnamed protein product [Meganyctiphanes norvegica]|uniref:Constitutive coactivator of peroxisome proliferator-activated receptor gamma n=1 Tax=Meganyctiphanes norvegica TaxID=48144 RepID=A0AAV2Q672_MEGNR
MGLKGLTSFLENHTPAGTEVISISQLVNETIKNDATTRSTSSVDQNAILVVDTMSCLRDWYQKSSSEFISGGQWKQYKEHLQLFIDQCAKVGLKLIFYMDGPCEQLKRAVWIQRRKETSKKIINSFNKLCQGYTSEFLKPPALSSFTTMYLKEMGQTVLYATGEGDYDTMKYAVESPLCIGVLGMDSDYLAFCGSKPLFPPDRFNPANNRAVMWNKAALKRTLSLDEEDIPVLGCLLGNDLIDDQLLKSFKFKVSPGPGGRRAEMLVPAVAAYLTKFKREKGHDIIKLQEEVICKSQKESKIFVEIIKSYVFPGKNCPWIPINDTSVGYAENKSINRLKCPNHILEIAKKRSLSKVYKLLKFGVDDCSNYFEAGYFMPQAKLYENVRRRLYSIVLADVELKNPTIEEWYVYEGNPMNGPDIVEPLALLYQGSQIKMLTLWDNDCGNDLKIWALKGCLGLKNQSNDDDDRDVIVEEEETDYWCSSNSVSKYSEHFTVAIFVLRYLAKNLPGIVLHDIKSFLTTAVKCESITAKDISRIQKRKPDGRAAQLATLYIRGLTQLVKVNVVCGNPFNSNAFMPNATFDGILFQETYQNQYFIKEGFSYIFKNDLEKIDLCENILNDITHDLSIPNEQPVSKRSAESEANSNMKHERRGGKNNFHNQYQGHNRNQFKDSSETAYMEQTKTQRYSDHLDSTSYNTSHNMYNQRTYSHSQNSNSGNDYKRAHDEEHFNPSPQKYMFEGRGHWERDQHSWNASRGRGNYSGSNWNNDDEYNNSYPRRGHNNLNRGRGRSNFSRGNNRWNGDRGNHFVPDSRYN